MVARGGGLRRGRKTPWGSRRGEKECGGQQGREQATSTRRRSQLDISGEGAGVGARWVVRAQWWVADDEGSRKRRNAGMGLVGVR